MVVTIGWEYLLNNYFNVVNLLLVFVIKGQKQAKG